MKKIFFRTLVVALAGLTMTPAFAWRGGFGGGAFVAHGPNGGTVAGDWHAGGAEGWGGTWHDDGWHGGAWGGYGYHAPVVVNSYYGGGCYSCAAGAVAGAAIAGAAVGAAAANAAARNYAIGMSLATLPGGCAVRIVNGDSFYICNGAWLAPRYGNNGVYYVVVDPLM